MGPLSYQSTPKLRRPVLIAAFEGWNDAGEAATMALGFLRKSWSASSYATLDPEEFFDFTVRRPQVRLVDNGRVIDWPNTEFSFATPPGSAQDAILVSGVEPSIRWKSFCASIVQVAKESGAEMAITLGALLSDVPHSRPVPVIGAAYDQSTARRFGFVQSRYEGPTGIVGVLNDALHRAGIGTAGLWAQVPYYLQANPSPKAALELVRRLRSVIDFEADTTELEEASRSYEQDVDDAVRRDPEIVAQVRELESRMDADQAEIPSGDELAAELERFLRTLRGDGAA